MGVLMELDIIVDKPKVDYIHIIDIERNFQSGEYFKAVMHLSCLIESNLSWLSILKLPIPPQNFEAREVKKIQNLQLKLLIDWAAGKPIPKNKNLICYPDDWKIPLFNEKEKLILENLREIRNDIAHVPFLTYDKNLRKEVVRRMIDDIGPIHGKLVEEIIKLTEKR